MVIVAWQYVVGDPDVAVLACSADKRAMMVNVGVKFGAARLVGTVVSLLCSAACAAPPAQTSPFRRLAMAPAVLHSAEARPCPMVRYAVLACVLTFSCSLVPCLC